MNSRDPSKSRRDSKVILDAIRHIVRRLRLSARDADARVGLSAAQLFVLHKLSDGSAVSLGELATRTFTDASSVSVVVDKLARRRLVRRVRAPNDGRRLEISLTPVGRKTLRRAPGVAQDDLIDALARLTAKQRADLSKLLAEVVRQLGGEREAPGLFFEEGKR